MRQARCPTCEAPVGAKAQNPHFPFCGQRCQSVDLGHWLGERYRFAGEPTDPSLPPDAWNEDI